MRHIIPISGKDSLCTAIVQMALKPELAYEFIYNDTMMELPETYEWLALVEKTMGISIHRIGKNLEEVIEEQRVLPTPMRRYCTKYSKIFPMQDWMGKEEGVVYLGIRADEDRVGGMETKTLRMAYPLRDAGIKLPNVYQILDTKGLQPPTFFWPRLAKAVEHDLGGLWNIAKELPRYIYDRTFSWRSRPNCFMCFYQRQYEWAGLLEFHPELFARAEAIEQRSQKNHEGADYEYYWLGKDFPLGRIRERADEIFRKRVAAICKMIRAKAQRELWSDALFDEMELAQKSCGLFCGK